MPNIPTLAEARDALDTLRRFVEGLEATLGATLGHPPRNVAVHIESIKTSTESNSSAALSWSDRVRAIMLAADRPLQPKDIMAEYDKRRFKGESPVPNFGNRIRSVLWQLKGRGEVIHDPNTGKYRLKDMSS